LEILLDQVERPGQPRMWLFSQETLAHVPAAFASVQHTDYSNYFPAWSRDVTFFSVPLWRWLSILFFIILVFVSASLLTRTLLWLLEIILKRSVSGDVKGGVLALKSPVFFLILSIAIRIGGGYAITALGRHYWKTIAFVLTWISAVWLLIKVTDILISFVRHRYLLRGQVERATFASLIGRIFKILAVLVLIIALLTQAGVNVSALITGLGIGGVAIALAAQKTLADLFGGLSIIMRGAVRVGDFCQIDGISGTVEDIGVSALSLRTLTRSVVSIPNSKVAEVGLENFSLRDQFWMHPVFTLRFDTSHQVLKEVLDQLDKIVKSHPEINPRSARARLVDLTPTGPQIEVFAYFRRPGADMAAFLEQQEGLLLKMVDAIETAGASLSTAVDGLRPPSQRKPESPSSVR
jgi:MscS family membrane protein